MTKSTTLAEPPVNPPELTDKQRALQEDIEALEHVRDNLLCAQEVLSRFDFSWGDLQPMIDSVTAEIADLEWLVNQPEGSYE